MLRSIQTLRNTSSDAQILAADDDQLALIGGGDNYYMPWHWHDCLMILLPRVGVVDFRDETRKTPAWLSEDRFVVVPKNLSHQTTAPRRGHEHLAIYATDDQLAGMATRLGSLNRVRTKLKAPTFFAVSREMRSLLGLCQAGAPDNLAAQSARSHLVAALLINCLSQIERNDPLPASTSGSHGDALVSEMKCFIRNNAASDLSLDLIGATFGLSRRHLTRLFREKTGVTIGEFHEQERIARARLLLTTTDLPVGEIAWRVGLESGSALARMMRRVAGISPTAARRHGPI
ncbi:helix-turn-helix transcriptional regulator [Bradyrhizobium diazoefficiens]|uniref:helix-turn-helix domain-containing protein n=1 Tax=Bradyrhizobium diazoefficiens TaxID=1355477 RepID=UPI00190A507A|nr:AraC family transcriptional regulator [Bradyrhizobium diazoefficiens]QQO17525.1 helix-turn-helix transcriptional regulator [Bradyrhizobium diazoefficiens]